MEITDLSDANINCLDFLNSKVLTYLVAHNVSYFLTYKFVHFYTNNPFIKEYFLVPTLNFGYFYYKIYIFNYLLSFIIDVTKIFDT